MNELNVPFNQATTGSIEVNGGTLLLGGGGTIDGSMTIDSGATLYFGSAPSPQATFELEATSNLSGAGSVVVAGPAVNEDGTYNLSGTTGIGSGATLTFSSGATIGSNLGSFDVYTGTLDVLTNQSFSINAIDIFGTANFSVPAPHTVTIDQCTIDGGTLTGTAHLAITGPLAWNQGAIVDSGTIDAMGGMAITGANNQTPNFVAATLNNYGTATWSGGNINADDAVFNNEPGATFGAQSDANFRWDGNGTVPIFNNLAKATFVKSGGTGAGGTHMGLVFNNDGTVDIRSGTLNLGVPAPTPDGSATSSGAFLGAQGTTLNLTGVDQNLTETSNIDVPNVGFADGNVNVAGAYIASGQTLLLTGAHVNFSGTVTLGATSSLDIVPTNGDAFANFSPGTPATLTVGECTLTGALSGTDSFTIDGLLTLGLPNATAGTLNTSGTVNAMGGMTIAGAVLQYGTLNNFGTATWNGVGLIGASYGAVFNNEPGAVFNAQAGADFTQSGGGNAPAFNNDGSFNFQGGVVLTVGGTSHGSFTGQPGSSLQISGQNLTSTSSLTADQVSLSSSTVAGTYDATTSTTIFGNNVQFTGTVDSLGALTIGATTTVNFSPATGGPVPLTLPSLTMDPGATLSGTDSFIVSALLSGVGTINANVTSDGQVSPGGRGAPGILTINGTYSQSSSAALNIELGGPTPGIQYDQLDVNGPAYLGGTLDLSFLIGPVWGHTYAIANASPLIGTFGTINDLNPAGGPTLTPAYGTGTLTITAQQFVGPPTYYTVNLTSDTGSSSGTDATTGTASGDLLWAITQANANTNPAGSIIEFDQTDFNSTSPQTIILSNTLELSEWAGPVVIQGPGENLLTISGDNAVQVLVVDSTATATLNGLTITAGSSHTGAGIDNQGALTLADCSVSGNNGVRGGGIDNQGALTLTDCTISGNNSRFIGGGIDNKGTLAVTDCTISGNTTVESGGGTCNYGLLTMTNCTVSGNYSFDGGGVGNYGTATMTGCTVSGNSGSNGGGIYNNGMLKMTDCILSGNSAQGGGGIANRGQATLSNSTLTGNCAENGGGFLGTSPTLTDCILSCNSAQNDGGGVYASYGPMILTDSTVADNKAGGEGGGIFFGFGALTINDSNIAGNEAGGHGGGVYVSDSPTYAQSFPLVLALNDSTIADNSASNAGGGIYMSLGALTITSSTIADNITSSPGMGGGLANHAVSATLDNTIVNQNTDPNGADDVAGAAVSASSSYNLIGTDETGSLTNGSHGNQVGITNPGLGPLASNGGPTQTIALLPGSPAIDAGSANIPGVTIPTTDQRGALRGPTGLNAGGAPDVGAYEASSSYLVMSTAASTDVGTLVAAIGWASASTNANPADATSPAPNTLMFATAGDYVLAAPDLASLDPDLAALAPAVVTAVGPVSITIDLDATTYQNMRSNGNTLPIDVTAPANTSLILNGPASGTATLYDLVTSGAVTVQGNVTIIGSCPALVVNSGQTTIAGGVTLVTSTNAPTIWVSGGTLVVRDSTIEESTGYAQAAILINGGSVNLGTTANPGGNTFNVNGTGTLIENTGAGTVTAVGDTFADNGSAVASNLGNVSLSAAAAQTANEGISQPFSLGSLTDTVADSQVWALDVNWGDGSAHTDFTATSTGPLTSRSHAFALPGTYTVTVTATDSVASGVTIWDLVQSFTVTVAPSIFVLNPTASGALTLSSYASITIPGAVVVDSSSKTALAASGSAQVTAATIEVVGGVQKSGGATFSPTPTTGVAPLADPLAGLSGPTTSGLTSYGSVNLSSGSSTINPGIYSRINVSGTGTRLTLNPGTYIIEGGGLTVSGSASLTGSGVFLYNAGSNYPGSGGSYGGITLSGSGTIELTAPTSGPYAGIVIFQSRDNTRALSFSGSAMSGMSGTIYAANALLSISGSAQIQDTLDVGTLNLSGSAAVTPMVADMALRALTVQGLNIPGPPDGAALPMAAGFRPANGPPILRVVPRPGVAAVDTVAMTALVAGPNRQDAAWLGGSTNGSGSPKPVTIRAAEATTVVGQTRPVPVRARSATPLGTLVNTVIEGLGVLPSLLDADTGSVPSPLSRPRRPFA